MIEIKKIIKILVLSLLASGVLVSQDNRDQQYEKFDPLILNEPFLPMGDGTMIKEIITDVKETTVSQTDTVKYISKIGWRIQALTTEDMFVADSTQKKLVQEFGDQDVKKIYNSPYWKIRIGNCATRQEAERLLDKVEELGFDRAWIIRARVRVKEKTFPKIR